MAILASTHWHVRAGGSALNGGGYDPSYLGAGSSVLTLTDLATTGTVSLTSATGGFTSGMVGFTVKITAGTNFKADYYRIETFVSSNEVTLDRVASFGSGSSGSCYVGANYANQDAAQLSLTDFATPSAGSTTLTSATGGFTAAMVGLCLRMASGTNFQTGYYFVTAYTDTNTVTLDRTPTSGGAGSGGTGRLGGAFASNSGSLSNGGSVTAPAITTPLAAGHTVWVRGGGTDNPASADYTQTGWAQYPSGDATSGRVRWIGYNGRPRIDLDWLYAYNCNYWLFDTFMFVWTSGANDAQFGPIAPPADNNIICRNVRVDQAGYDKAGMGNVAHVVGCEFVNSGSTSAGSRPAIGPMAIFCQVVGNSVSGWRGPGIVTGSTTGVVSGNIVAECGGRGIDAGASVLNHAMLIEANTVYGCSSDGIRLSADTPTVNVEVRNNILDSNGGYGINYSSGSAALNDRLAPFCDYNAFRNNTSGALNGISAGAHDVTLTADPFTNAAGGDFTLNSTAGGGAALKGVAFPTSIP